MPEAEAYLPEYPLQPDVRRALDRKAWALTDEARALIHEHLSIAVDGCNAGYPVRAIDKAEALERIAQMTLDDALTPYGPNLKRIAMVSDTIARTAREYADAVNTDMVLLQKRGMLLGPVLKAA